MGIFLVFMGEAAVRAVGIAVMVVFVITVSSVALELAQVLVAGEGGKGRASQQ